MVDWTHVPAGNWQQRRSEEERAATPVHRIGFGLRAKMRKRAIDPSAMRRVNRAGRPTNREGGWAGLHRRTSEPGAQKQSCIGITVLYRYRHPPIARGIPLRTGAAAITFDGRSGFLFAASIDAPRRGRYRRRDRYRLLIIETFHASMQRQQHLIKPPLGAFACR